MSAIKILATRRGGEQCLVEVELPFTVSQSATDDKFQMYYLRDANGTDHYFNKDDGTYDGWGAGMCGE